MDIEAYPSFRPMELGDKAIFDKAFTADPPEISEFTFTNLYSWREAYKITISMLNGLLIVRSRKDRMPAFFCPIGSGDVNKAITVISQETRGIFMRLPERVASLFKTDGRFSIEPDTDNWDYLFRTRDLTSLPGRKYDGKRNLIKRFRSTYKHEYISLDATNAQDCLVFEDRWCTVRDCDSVEGLKNERAAIREMIANFSFFNITGGAIKADGKICAIALAERLNTDTLVMHVMKADPGMAGLYQTMLNEFLLRHGEAFEYVNLEQDLGVEGMRKSKLSYHPAAMIKKYTLKPGRKE